MDRIAILYSGLSGYSAACQKALQVIYKVKLLVVHWPVLNEAPFNKDIYDHIDQRIDKKNLSRLELLEKIRSYQPQAVLISGWMDQDYLFVARKMKLDGIPVIASSDTQYSGSYRQLIARVISPWYLHSAIDIMWVTGERQKRLAYYLGFRGQKCWTGFYSCDWEKFATQAFQPVLERKRVFLFVGRYIPRKGIETLLKGYRKYRDNTDAPWALWTIGTGKLSSLIEKEEGVVNIGFIQPAQLPKIMHQAMAFVNSSNVEPWGVAIHEAASAGLPLICSDACGAAVHLLEDYHNGFHFEPGNSLQLSQCFKKISHLSHEQWSLFSQNSFQLSKQFSPGRWARTFMEGVKYFNENH